MPAEHASPTREEALRRRGPDLLAGAALAWLGVMLVLGVLAPATDSYVPFGVLLPVGLVLVLAGGRLEDGADLLGLTQAVRGLLMGCAAYLVAALPIMALQWAWVRFVLPEDMQGPQQEILRWLMDSRDPWRVALMGLCLTTVVPLFEEGLFRGWVMNGLRGSFDRVLEPRGAAVLSVLVSAVLFALTHPMAYWVTVFILGVLLGVLYLRTGSFWSVVAFHACHNAWTIVYLRIFGEG